MTAVPAAGVVLSGRQSPDVVAARDRIVAELRDAGLRATADPRNAQPPCVLVERPSMVPFGNFCANLRIQWVLHLLVKGPDNTETWDRLEGMRRRVWPLFVNEITGCDPDTYEINDTTSVASYRIQFEQVV